MGSVRIRWSSATRAAAALIAAIASLVTLPSLLKPPPPEPLPPDVGLLDLRRSPPSGWVGASGGTYPSHRRKRNTGRRDRRGLRAHGRRPNASTVRERPKDRARPTDRARPKAPAPAGEGRPGRRRSPRPLVHRSKRAWKPRRPHPPRLPPTGPRSPPRLPLKRPHSHPTTVPQSSPRIDGGTGWSSPRTPANAARGGPPGPPCDREVAMIRRRFGSRSARI
jgi:hypothetical protein